ncbi:MAG TPA: carbamoyltransferase HypF [Chitinophagaceae bacterium]|nr:carbamoyltransferase HypF [Chitinophagaceae bacterium]
MKTYHIHIGGLVQGVGFRPHVYRTARREKLNGWVSNTKDGVHIEINALAQKAFDFLDTIIAFPPANAMIASYSIKEIPAKQFASFTIQTSIADTKADLLLTPDFAMCESCRQEILNDHNRRYSYPFTTCLHCGPRYSIINELPYERDNTTMAELKMCSKCSAEHNDVNKRRHYSQTNSCPNCAIPMHFYKAGGHLLSDDAAIILKKLNEVLSEGAIAAVKGIGGYLLLCDATNKISIQRLRQRKYRPAKPFALLYPCIEKAKGDVYVSAAEESLLKDKSGPIILCRMKNPAQNEICKDEIAPGLDKIGLMLPYSPLLQLIATAFDKPLIATSANISGSPIIYQDDEAIDWLSNIADYILVYDREIVTPQDDSVIQLTNSGKKIILRRSRGLAPNYFPNPFNNTSDCILATGGELKSAFALQDHHHLYISQYLGNQENLSSQKAFTHTVDHLLRLLQIRPSLLLADKHPGYFVSQHAGEMSLIKNIPLIGIQHHHAHFGAVLAENNLLNTKEPVLGVVWDGTGYGDDKQIWGGEFLIYEDGEIKRAAHLEYFPQLLGDKMSREPRLSALSLLKFLPSLQEILKPNFSSAEWQYYQQLIAQTGGMLTSSMGRFLDGLASLLGICHVNTYEAEAAMKLETVARSCTDTITDYYPLPLKSNRVDFTLLLQELENDLKSSVPVNYIARKIFYSLAVSIERVSNYFLIDRIAFSGGVFQNALLTDMITELLENKKQLYWHRQLSPNDECIGFGQLACYHIWLKTNKDARNAKLVPQNELHH